MIRHITPLFYSTIVVALIDESTCETKLRRTELDSHANMPVVGKGAYLLNETARTASVSAYNPNYSPMDLPIVDAAVLYEDNATGDATIIVIKNALLVESMRVNLIPPFIMREHGIKVLNNLKIHKRVNF